MLCLLFKQTLQEEQTQPGTCKGAALLPCFLISKALCALLLIIKQCESHKKKTHAAL